MTAPVPANPTRLIAVDMDGTFLTTQGEYDRERFARLHEHLQDADIQFVVASGNQHGALAKYFVDYPETMYIAENGALVGTTDKAIRTSSFPTEVSEEVIAQVAPLPNVLTLVCCESSAYVLRNTDPAFIDTLGRYYATITLVDNWDEVDELVLKFALNCYPEETPTLMEAMRRDLPAGAVPTSSGHGSVDIIPNGVDKGTALAWLGEELGIKSDEMVAFGDGGNDLEMLKLVGTGVAMANAPIPVKEIADDITLSNNDQGVLNWLENYLEITD